MSENFKSGYAYKYQRKINPTPNLPNGATDEGIAHAVETRHGMTLYAVLSRQQDPADDCEIIHEATQFISHPDGTEDMHVYNDAGDSYHVTNSGYLRSVKEDMMNENGVMNKNGVMNSNGNGDSYYVTHLGFSQTVSVAVMNGNNMMNGNMNNMLKTLFMGSGTQGRYGPGRNNSRVIIRSDKINYCPTVTTTGDIDGRLVYADLFTPLGPSKPGDADIVIEKHFAHLTEAIESDIFSGSILAIIVCIIIFIIIIIIIIWIFRSIGNKGHKSNNIYYTSDYC